MRKTLLLLLALAYFVSLSAQNMMKNPGFESESNIPYKMTYNYKKGTVTDVWVLACHEGKNSVGDLIVSDVEKHGGEYSMEIQLDNIPARYSFFLTYDMKNIALGKYTLRFFAKANQADIPFRVDVIACSGDNYSVENELTGSSGKGKNGVYPANRAGVLQKTSTEWKEYTITFDTSLLTQDDLGLLRLAIRPNCEKTGLSPVVNTPVTYWFDDFELTLNK